MDWQYHWGRTLTALNKDAMKLLGVTIQHNLKRSRHVIEMIKKANTKLHFLRVRSKGLPDVSQWHECHLLHFHPSRLGILRSCVELWPQHFTGKWHREGPETSMPHNVGLSVWKLWLSLFNKQLPVTEWPPHFPLWEIRQKSHQARFPASWPDPSQQRELSWTLLEK